jgi:hypothetical protein
LKKTLPAKPEKLCQASLFSGAETVPQSGPLSISGRSLNLPKNLNPVLPGEAFIFP